MLNDSMQFVIHVVTGIIIGVIVLSLVCTSLPILIPVCICCCLGVGICGASRNRGPSSRVVTIYTAAPPPPLTTAVVTTTQTSQKVDYPTGAYPTQQPTSSSSSSLCSSATSPLSFPASSRLTCPASSRLSTSLWWSSLSTGYILSITNYSSFLQT